MKTFALAIAALAGAVWIIAIWIPDAIADSQLTTTVVAGDEIREYGYGQIRFNGKGPEAWRWQAIQERRRADDLQRRLTARVLEARSLRRTLKHESSVREALDLACTIYGHCADLHRKAFCESRLDPRAKNRTSSARGLLQFLTTGRIRRYGSDIYVDGGTWATTPFWSFDVYSPYANALAAGWMHANGRAGEWECR